MVLVTQQWDSSGQNLFNMQPTVIGKVSFLLKPIEAEPCPTHQQRPDFCGAASQKSILRRIYSGLAIHLVS